MQITVFFESLLYRIVRLVSARQFAQQCDNSFAGLKKFVFDIGEVTIDHLPLPCLAFDCYV